jgi:hypothetical protein
MKRLDMLGCVRFLSEEKVEAHRRGAEDAESTLRKAKSLRPLRVLCASAVNRPMLYTQEFNKPKASEQKFDNSSGGDE